MYQFLDNNGKILYVGKAKDLRNRVSSYFLNSSLIIGKTKLLVDQIAFIKIIEVESELESLLLEAALIKEHTPKYNIRLTDGKSYPLIRITINNQYPAVLTARKMEDKKSLYFGPYPNATSMHKVLRIMRRIFPFQSTLNHAKKYCLYYHLGLCPCPPMFVSDEQKRAYKKTLNRIKKFLEGKSKEVVEELTKERDEFAKNENFEKALENQQILDAIARVTQPFVKPFEYVTNPNLREDIRQKEMESLQDVLKKHNVNIELPVRIECYDNSNFQGSNAVSSLVVLTQGEIDTSQYRRFKVKNITGANDFATMQEIFARRLNHKEWPLPQLFVVDGGKGQVSSTKEVFQKLGVSIPLIGLAKRDEILITSEGKEIKLPKSAPGLQLIMRIRDEAHRFAITYHRKLRSKASFD